MYVQCDALYQDKRPSVLRRLEGDTISTSRFAVFRLVGFFGIIGSIKNLTDLQWQKDFMHSR